MPYVSHTRCGRALTAPIRFDSFDETPRAGPPLDPAVGHKHDAKRKA